jgi:hypothetical protein
VTETRDRQNAVEDYLLRHTATIGHDSDLIEKHGSRPLALTHGSTDHGYRHLQEPAAQAAMAMGKGRIVSAHGRLGLVDGTRCGSDFNIVKKRANVFQSPRFGIDPYPAEPVDPAEEVIPFLRFPAIKVGLGRIQMPTERFAAVTAAGATRFLACAAAMHRHKKMFQRFDHMLSLAMPWMDTKPSRR